ncbi:MAG: anhydro-N-acetylmuramic acid kinase [Paracoccaceae bacterium]
MGVETDGEARDGAVWALGLMSGTSLDGVDASLILTDGERILDTGPSLYEPYDADTLPALSHVMAEPAAFRDGTMPGAAEVLGEAAREVVRVHARAAAALIADAPAARAPAVVGFPGQTVLHAPERGLTWQIGDGAALARALGRAVVWDFRTDDVAAGGQGAPLAPFFHWAAMRSAGLAEPVAVLNIGGVANVTWVDPRAGDPTAPGALVAFDTGPGNALVNDWMAEHDGRAMDAGGGVAAAGRAARARLAQRLRTNTVADHLGRPPPKSLDRNAFNALPRLLEGESVEDGAAALTGLTVDCAAAALDHLPTPPARWLVCGGGRYNATMMAWLAEALDGAVEPIEAVGLDGDMLEAQAFGFLAVRVLRGMATSGPSTTGAARAVSGGRVATP